MPSTNMKKAPSFVHPYLGSRTSAVSVSERISNAIFGSPSVRRANGGGDPGFPGDALLRFFSVCKKENRLANDEGLNIEAKRPVFGIDRMDGDGVDRLPRIWVSESVFDQRSPTKKQANCSNRHGERAFVASYPNGADEGGWKAMELADRCFGEALSSFALDNEARLELFRASEILYLHAQSHGNIAACLKLADIYRFNMCSGRYWTGYCEARAKHAKLPDRAELLRRAWSFAVKAALAGDAGGFMRLGDIELEGSGEEGVFSDDRLAYSRAYRKYIRSLSLLTGGEGEAEPDVLQVEYAILCCGEQDIFGMLALGQASLRVAKCRSRGLGCDRDVVSALDFFQCAENALQSAFAAGSWHAKRELIEARRGIGRMKQEMGIMGLARA